MLLPKRFIALAALVLAVASGCSDGAPGGTEEGTVRSGEIELRWFLDFPEGDGPFPGVVYGPGSGDVSAASKSTVEFARELNELGFAVMRYDKRGVGGSGGELVAVSTANSGGTILRLASDMGAVLDELLANSRIDRERIGLVGASQATWYMPVVAEATPEVRFMVVITGPALPVGFQNRYEEMTRFEELSQEEAELQLGLLSDYEGPLGFNPIPILEDLDIPLLYLLGGEDPASPRQANIVAAEELKANGADVEYVVYPEGVHLLPDVDFWPDVAAWFEPIGVVE
jgi:pimeloyl-ACP methyl ester carboxylesterase